MKDSKNELLKELEGIDQIEKSSVLGVVKNSNEDIFFPETILTLPEKNHNLLKSYEKPSKTKVSKKRLPTRHIENAKALEQERIDLISKGIIENNEINIDHKNEINEEINEELKLEIKEITETNNTPPPRKTPRNGIGMGPNMGALLTEMSTKKLKKIRMKNLKRIPTQNQKQIQTKNHRLL